MIIFFVNEKMNNNVNNKKYLDDDTITKGKIH